MTYQALIDLYARHVEAGLRSIERVPVAINGYEVRKYVILKLEQNKNQSDDGE